MILLSIDEPVLTMIFFALIACAINWGCSPLIYHRFIFNKSLKTLHYETIWGASPPQRDIDEIRCFSYHELKMPKGYKSTYAVLAVGWHESSKLFFCSCRSRGY